MSDATDQVPAREETEKTVGGMPGELLEGTDPGVLRGEDRITSSGVAPTGGVPVGGATDRIIPDRTIPRTTDNVEPSRNEGRATES